MAVIAKIKDFAAVFASEIRNGKVDGVASVTIAACIALSVLGGFAYRQISQSPRRIMDSLARVSHLSPEKLRRDCSTRPLYMFTNEGNREETKQILAQHALTRGQKGLHIGVSGLENYNFIWHNKSTHALLIDIDPRMVNLHKQVVDLLAKSKGREDFITKLRALIPDEMNLNLNRESRDPGSWLGSDEAFAYIRRISKVGAIQSVVMDVTHTDQMIALGKLLKARRLPCTTFYLSNAADWSFFGSHSDYRNFYQKILPIVSRTTLLIDSACDFLLSQRVYRAPDFCQRQPGAFYAPMDRSAGRIQPGSAHTLV